jgi:uncharacterized membrane protein
LHQVLQVHSMLSAILPQDELVNVKTSMIWDGIFHALTWIFTVAGIVVLFRTLRPATMLMMRPGQKAGRYTFGMSIVGWGLFNVIEGALDHVVFQIHHVVEKEGLSVYDYSFLVLGLIQCIAGWLVARSAVRIPRPARQ